MALGHKQQEAFDELKTRLTSTPILRLPRFDRRFHLHTDASNVAIGAVLQQADDNGEYHVVSYASRTLSKAERNYTTTERECLAVVHFVTEFRPYLWGSRFKLLTDHQSLTWLLHSKRESTARLTRWMLRLQEYDMKIKHHDGCKHANADATRAPIVNEDMAKVNAITEDIELSKEALIAAQETESPTREYIIFLRDGTLPDDGKWAKRVALEAGQLHVNDEGILCRCWWPQRNDRRADTRVQVVVPPSLRDPILHTAHNSAIGGHMGFDRTFCRVRDRYWWPQICRAVEDWVKKGPQCQIRNSPKGCKAGILHPIPVTRTWERLGIDFTGPLKETRRGNKYLLCIIDYHTKYAEVFPTKDMEGETVARIFVEQVACRFGVPESATSDRGKYFIEGVFGRFQELAGIQGKPSTAYHPQTDGLVERFNGTFKDILAKFAGNKHEDWDIHIPYARHTYNSSVQTSTGDTPFFLMFGRDPLTPVDIVVGHKGTLRNVPEFFTNLNRAREIARKNSEEVQKKQKRH